MTINKTKSEIKFFSRIYDEALLLLNQTREYIRWQQPKDIEHLTPYECLQVNCENTRITTRLMHIMAWMLLQKAIQAGEISAKDADSEDFSLPMSESYLNHDATHNDSLPNRLKELLETSRLLYLRVARLEIFGREVSAVSQYIH